MRLSVIIPTTGRKTLGAAEHSAAEADEVIVVGDNTGDRGYTAREKGMAQATGTHLAFLDDDDVYLPGAVEAMRQQACDAPVIFKMDDPLHGVIWRDRVLRYANVGTPMFLVPNDPARLGRWAPFERDRGGDFSFISGCVEKMGGPVWREEIVAKVRPHERTSLTVVTPWWNHRELEGDYWEAMRAADVEVLVVDNGSDPPLPNAWRLPANSGFARACNVGLDLAQTEAVLFLNNDIAATTVGWDIPIRKAIEPGVLVGAQLRYDSHGSVEGTSLPYLDGWCLAGFRRDLLELGGFDEGYEEPAYYSDNDLCLRARAAGMTLREVKVGLRHKLNGTARRDDPVTVEATLANRERFRRVAEELLGVAA